MASPPSPPSSLPTSPLFSKLSSRRCLVTGPALDGVGRVLAHILSANGAEVLLADILPLETVAAECRALGAKRVICVQFDAGLEGDSARMVREGAAQFSEGVIDAIFLNHNAGCFSPMLEQKDLVPLARRLMRINFFSYAEIEDTARPLLLKAAQAAREKNSTTSSSSSCFSRSKHVWIPSSIVVISSLAAEVATLDTHAYAASKAAISKWFECLQIETERDIELKKLVSISIVYFSAVKTQTLINAMGGLKGPNKHVLDLAAEPKDAAFAVIEASLKGLKRSYFPAYISWMPYLNTVWPSLVRGILDGVKITHTATSRSNSPDEKTSTSEGKQ
jgi:NAD(P)-dependent dehydrogenase (short-subunit alcohol dehydrogenase family)